MAKIRGTPAERELWERLLDARSVEEVQVICGQSQYWLNPRRSGKPFVEVLSSRADQFLAAKNDRRYPASRRPSSDDRRLRFLARAMAGVTLGRSPRTSVDLLGKRNTLGLGQRLSRGPGTEGIIGPLQFEFAIIKPNGEVAPLN